MRPHFFSKNHTRTPFVELNTEKCKACWKCIEACPSGVMGKVDLPWHKHILFENPASCSGCFECINECDSGAVKKVIGQIHKNKTETRNLSLSINICLLIVAAAAIFSGFLIQISYHMGHHGEIAAGLKVYGLNYYGWSDFHKISIALLTVLVTIHTILHRKWYSIVLKKNLVSKNLLVIILTALFILVAITGYASWTIHITNGSEAIRKFFIEFHDKLTLFLFVFLLIHISKRLKWFASAFRRETNHENNK